MALVDTRREDRAGVVVTLPVKAGPYLTTAEALAYCRVGRTKLYAACASGHLRHVRVGVGFRFQATWLEAWLAAGAKSVVDG